MKLSGLFRFRLLSLMVVFTCITISTGWFTNALRATKLEQNRIAELHAAGVELHFHPIHAFDDENKLKSKFVEHRGIHLYSTAPPPMPKPLWSVFGKGGLSRIGSLDLDGQISYGSNLTLDCEQLAPFKQIHELRLCYFQLHNLSAIQNLPNLQKLDLFSCDLGSLDGLEHCKNLVEVDIAHCDQLVDFDALANLPNIETLSIRQSVNKQAPISQTSFVERCRSLKSLILLGPISRKVRPEQIDKLELLEYLGVSQLKDLTNLNQFAGLKNIKRLKISGGQLTELSALVNFPPLEVLHINNCENIEKFTGLWDQANIQELILGKCNKLSHLYDELHYDGDPGGCVTFGIPGFKTPFSSVDDLRRAVESGMPQ